MLSVLKGVLAFRNVQKIPNVLSSKDVIVADIDSYLCWTMLKTQLPNNNIYMCTEKPFIAKSLS